MKEEMRLGTWTPAPYLHSVELIFSLKFWLGGSLLFFPVAVYSESCLLLQKMCQCLSKRK